ncbi:MAG: hypothetical protein ABI818_00430 [Acidobacteriota bacterium]
MAAIAGLGFASVINLRQATENGANIEGEAARAAGLRFIHCHSMAPPPEPTVSTGSCR